MKACLALLLLAAACARHDPVENKPVSRVTAPEITPRPEPSAAPTPACSASTDPALPPLKLTEMKSGPPSVPLSANPGVWLADETSALLSSAPLTAWAEGPVRPGPDHTATRGVALAKLPKALRAWLGRPVKVMGSSGAVCDTRLQRFAIRAQITPDLRTAEHWEGCAEGPPITPDAIASEVWRLTASAGRSLVGEFSAPCKGALLAVDPDLPLPVIAGPRPASADEGDAALGALRSLQEYAAIQARFRAEQPDAEGQWDDHDARRSVSVLALPGQDPVTLVSVEVGAGCASARGFSASLSALTSPSIHALAAIDDRRVTPSAIVDFGAGSVILLGPDGHFRARSALRWNALGSTRAFSSSVPFFPGPC